MNKDSFREAIAGCDVVLHTASPYILTVTNPQQDLVVSIKFYQKKITKNLIKINKRKGSSSEWNNQCFGDLQRIGRQKGCFDIFRGSNHRQSSERPPLHRRRLEHTIHVNEESILLQ